MNNNKLVKPFKWVKNGKFKEILTVTEAFKLLKNGRLQWGDKAELRTILKITQTERASKRYELCFNAYDSTYITGIYDNTISERFNGYFLDMQTRRKQETERRQKNIYLNVVKG